MCTRGGPCRVGWINLGAGCSPSDLNDSSSLTPQYLSGGFGHSEVGPSDDLRNIRMPPPQVNCMHLNRTTQTALPRSTQRLSLRRLSVWGRQTRFEKKTGYEKTKAKAPLSGIV